MRNLIGVLIIFPEIKYYTATYELIRVRGRVVNGLEYERSQCDIQIQIQITGVQFKGDWSSSNCK